jgi:GxxExxY protein
MEKGDLTYRINGCAMLVHRKLGRGFREYVYCRALAIELKRAGIEFAREIWLPIHYDQYKLAARRCDFLCEGKVIVEVKARGGLSNEHLVQAINTVERLNFGDGLLINFGAETLQFKHIFNNKVRPESEFEEISPELVGEMNDELFYSRQYLPDWEVEKMQRDRKKGHPINPLKSGKS